MIGPASGGGGEPGSGGELAESEAIKPCDNLYRYRPPLSKHLCSFPYFKKS